MRALLLSTAALLATPALCQAADPAAPAPAQSTAALGRAEASGEEITVTATRTAEPVSGVGQSVTLFDADTIRLRQTALPLDLLRQAPGVSVAQNGGPGSVASVFIRGADSAQTVALIDGVKINDPSSPAGGFDFSSLVIGNIDRIEILRGPSSVLWGSQAIGGVVNLITRAPTEGFSLNARAEGGSYGTGQGVVNVSDTVGPVSASLGGGYFRARSTSAYDNGTEPDGYRNYGANASVSVQLAPTVSVDLRGFLSHNHLQIDGYPAPNYVFADDREYSVGREVVGYAGLNAGLFDDRLRNRVSFSYTDTRNRNYDPDGFVLETFAGNGRNERVEYQGVVDLARWAQATFGAEHERSHFTTSSYGGDPVSGHQTITSGYGQLTLTPVTGLTATGGVRYDDHSEFGGHTSGSASLAYTPNAGQTLVRASYTTGFKAPSLYQLLGDYGNATLRPETSRGWDAGVTQKLFDGVVEASATYYHRASRNLIEFVGCSGNLGICFDRPYGTYDNVAKARAQGVELGLSGKPTDALVLSANYTYLDATDRSPGADYGTRLARRPRNSVNGNADYRWGFGLKTGVTVSYASARYDGAGEINRLHGYTLVDLRAAYPLNKHLEVYGRIQNLADRHYETAYGYGQLGRAAYAGVRVSY